MENKKISELPQTTTINDGCCLPIVQNSETKKIYYSDLKSQVRPTFSINGSGHLIATYTDTAEIIDLGVVVGSQGIQGIQGEHGIDIDSVTQTTTSTANEGINIVTVTLSDGTVSTFEIRNGSKGDKGDIGNCYPIGSIYQQLPPVTIDGTTYTPLSPNDLWSGQTWVDISSGYGGAFFRANGGNSSTFGTLQSGQNASHTHTYTPSGTLNSAVFDYRVCYKRADITGTYTGVTYTGRFDNGSNNSESGHNFKNTHNHTFTGTLGTTSSSGGNENRPTNYAIKIWLRTA